MKKKVIVAVLNVIILASIGGLGIYQKITSEKSNQYLEKQIDGLEQELADTKKQIEIKDATIAEMNEKSAELEIQFKEIEEKYNIMKEEKEAAILAEEARIAEEKAKKQALSEEYLSVGDIITYGLYEQDGNGENGLEPIEWKVLDIEDGKALIISEKVLDCRVYNIEAKKITWEESDMREWLNDIFYNASFTEEEKERILKTTVVDRENVAKNVDPGNNTEDKIFLLDYTEVLNYFSFDTDRITVQTDYAIMHGASSYSDNLWVLRTPGHTGMFVMTIEDDGDLSGDGQGFFDDGELIYNKVPVRPALWIELY